MRHFFIATLLLVGCDRSIALQGPEGPPGKDGAPGMMGPQGIPGIPFEAGDCLEPAIWSGDDSSKAVVSWFRNWCRDGELCSIQPAQTYPPPVTWACLPPVHYGGSLALYLDDTCTGEKVAGDNSQGALCHFEPGNVLYCRGSEVSEAYKRTPEGECVLYTGAGPLFHWPETEITEFVHGELASP